MKNPEIDCLVEGNIRPNNIKYCPNFDGFEYFSKPTGYVRITSHCFIDIKSDKFVKERMYLAGICRDYYERKEYPPPTIANNTIEQIISEHNIPESAHDKKKRLVGYIKSIEESGIEDIQLFFSSDYPLIYSEKNDFKRIMRELHDEELVKYELSKEGYNGIYLTSQGRNYLNQVRSNEIRLSRVLPVEEIVSIRNSIRKADIEKALTQLVEILEGDRFRAEYEQIEQIYFEYNLCRNEFRQNQITQEERNVGLSKIRKKILDIL